LKGWTNEYIGINELGFQICLVLRRVNDNIENVRRARTEGCQSLRLKSLQLSENPEKRLETEGKQRLGKPSLRLDCGVYLGF